MLYLILMTIFTILDMILGNSYPTEILYKEGSNIEITAGDFQDLWYSFGIGFNTIKQSIGELEAPNPIVWDDFSQIVKDKKYTIDLKDGSQTNLIINIIWFIWAV